MANILIQKDASTLVPKLGITDAERAAWAVDYPIYDINADGSKGPRIGPTGKVGRSSLAPNVTDDAATSPIVLDASRLARAWAANTSALQAGLDQRRVFVQYQQIGFDDTQFIDSDTEIVLAAGAKLTRSGGTYGKLPFKTTNAHWYGDAPAIPGIAILFASDSGGVDGVGRLRRSGNTLFWTAPGDAEGAGVAITVGAAGSTGTARYELPSGTTSRKLHVCVSQPSLSGTTAAVRVHSSSGARAVTWVRASNVTTITEANHGRRAGDIIIMCGTGLIGQAYVYSVTDANTYTVQDSRSDSSGSGEVFGRRNITISGCGTISAGMETGSTLRSVEDAHGIVALGVSDFVVRGPMLRDMIKYGVYGQGLSGFDVDVGCYATNASSSTAGVQLNGKVRAGRVSCRGQSTDTMTALIAGDYPTQTYLLSTDEGSVHFDDVVVENLLGENCKFELCRMAGATGVEFRNIKIRNVRGSIDTSSAAMRAVAGMYDANVHNAGDCIFLGLEIDGVAVERRGANHLTLVVVHARGTKLSRGIKIRNVDLLNPLVANGDGFIAIGGPGSGTGNFDDVTVEKVFHRGAAWQGHAVIPQGAGSIKTLKLQDVQITVNNALVNTAWNSSCFTHNAALTIDRVIMDNCSLEEISAAGTKSDPWVILSGAGVVGSISVTRQRTKDNLSMGYVNKSMTGCAITLTDSEVSHSGTNYGVRFDQPAGSITLGGIRQTGTVPTDLVRIGYSSATMKVRSLGGLYTPGGTVKHVNIATGTSNAPDCHGVDLVCDTATIAAVQGAMVKTNAATSLLVYRNASAWVELA